MYDLLYSEEELKLFYNLCIPQLKPFQVFYMAIGARAKYLTKEEKEVYQLGRSEMLNKTLIRERDFSTLVKKIKRLEGSMQGYTTKNDLHIPESSLVAFWNVNPSNSLKAYYKFQETINNYQLELANLAMSNGDIENISNRFNKIQDTLFSCYQTSLDKSHWIDIDFDIPKPFYKEVVGNLTNKLEEKKVPYVVIDTRGGFHVMISKASVNFNYNGIVASSSYIASTMIEEGEKFEVVVNKGGLVPIPGLLQGSYQVKIKDYYLGE